MKCQRRGSDFFLKQSRSAREEGSSGNAVRSQGGGISMVHRCRLRPADGEVSLKYIFQRQLADQGQTNKHPIPSCTNITLLHRHSETKTLTLPESVPLSSFQSEPIVTVLSSPDRDMDTPNLSPLASPSMSLPICVQPDSESSVR